MKILYISQSVIPSRSANSVHVMKMCSSLAKQNNKVDLFCYNIKSDVEKNILNHFKFYNVEANFKLLRLKVFNLWFIRDLITLFYIVPKIIKKNYNLIICRSIQLSYFLSLLGYNTVLEIHSPPSRKTNFLFSKILKYGRINFLIVINDALKKYINNNYLTHKYLKIVILQDAAEKSNLIKTENKLLKTFNIKKNSVGYLGHLYQGRGVDLIIKLAIKFPMNNFYIVGGSDAHIHTWKEKIKSKNIYFLGFQNQKICALLRHRFDCLIAPYQKKVYVYGALSADKQKKSELETSKWMSPLKLFEYMEAKKPIISSNLPAIKEILQNYEDSILCDPEHINEWEKGLLKINNDKLFRKKIAFNAYKKFTEKYTWDIRATKLIFNFLKIQKRKNVAIFNYSLEGGGTEYMLTVLFNKLVKKDLHNINLVICKEKGHYIKKINDKTNLYILNKTRVIYSILSLYNFLRTNKIDTILTSMSHTNILAIIIKIFLYRKLKVIIRESNTISVKSKYTSNLKNNILNFLIKKIYNQADKIIAPTDVIKKDLIKNYSVKRSKIHKLVNPYNFDEINSKSVENVSQNEKKLLSKPFILSVGRLNPQKNYDLLIKIFKYVHDNNKKFKNYKLYILGEGREKFKLKKLIDNSNMSKSIYLLGFRSNPFIFMKRCKLFILTSKYEGHSNVLVHSQILKNKILASSAAGANTEILGKNGEIFTDTIPEKIGDKVIKILLNKNIKISDKKLYKKFSDTNVVSNFSELF
ncbi:MAG: hypothetical protein CMA12_00500 [Euryarchaeota archaeon]|nr:hypothetical protein [Euryarchaeota archaeon]